MAFDGITLHTIIKELQVLIDGKINQIYEPNKNCIVLNVYNKKSYSLLIDISATDYRINLTNHSMQNPIKAPNFCMLLRKYLSGSKISKIYMNELERIAYIEFECFNEMNDRVIRTLIIELMGKYSNIILANENLYIIDALKKFDGNGISRDIMPARKYQLPTSNKNDFLSLDDKGFANICLSSDYKSLDASISSLFTGFSKLFIQSCIDTLKLSNTLSEKSLYSIYKYINNLCNSDSNNISCKPFKNNYTVMYDSSKVSNSLLEVNTFIDEYYYNKSENEYYVNYKNSLLKLLSSTLDKLVKKLNNINDKIDSCSNIEQMKLFGELLLANTYKFKEPFLSKYVEVENYYDNNNLVKIPIDSSLNISKNADKYFKKYNKMKNTLSVTKIQKIETSKELDYLESLIYALDNCKNISDINDIYNELSENIIFSNLALKNSNKNKVNKKEDISSLNNYIKIKIDDFDVFIGKNNKQNDYLSLKIANSNDYWFHTKDIHGSHVILRCNGIMPKLTTIQKCAEFAAYYSQAKFSSHVPVDYTLAKYVKKPRGSVPGYVIYTNEKTMYVDPVSPNI